MFDELVSNSTIITGVWNKLKNSFLSRKKK